MARARRCFEAGKYYEVSDRTLGERYWLSPSPEVVAIMLAALGVARRVAPDVGVVIATLMSNHWHLVLRAGADANGISRFMQALKSHVARAMNRLLGRRGTFWSRRYASIALLDDDVVIERSLYALMNPTAAGLTRRIEEWPGFSSVEHLLGVPTACGPIDFAFEAPPSWVGLDDLALVVKRAALLDEVRLRERAVAAERMRVGLPVARVDVMLRRLRRDDRPSMPDRGPKPLAFASSPVEKRRFRAKTRAWNAAFTAASAAFRSGDLFVEFPARALPPRLTRPPTEAAA